MTARPAFATLLLAGFACAATARAQQPAAIVESEGEARVSVPPDSIRFAFSKSFNGPTLADTAAQAAAFEKALAQALGDLDSTPARQDPIQLRVPDLRNQITLASIEVTFPIPDHGAPAGAPAGTSPLVELAEKIRKAAVSLLANAAFAGFEVNDRETPEQEAIARAAENALYHAEAVGALLEGRVIRAERVTIVETRWDGLKPADGVLLIPPAIECLARVRIAYQYSSSAR